MTETHFHLCVTQNDEVLEDKAIEDPFITTTVTIPIEELDRMLKLQKDIIIKVNVSGDKLAYRGLFTIDWDLLKEQDGMKSVAMEMEHNASTG